MDTKMITNDETPNEAPNEAPTQAPDEMALLEESMATQIQQALREHGVRDLGEADPEYASFQQDLRSALEAEDAGGVVFAALKAGKAKAARLAAADVPRSTHQLWTDGYQGKVATTSAPQQQAPAAAPTNQGAQTRSSTQLWSDGYAASKGKLR